MILQLLYLFGFFLLIMMARYYLYKTKHKRMYQLFTEYQDFLAGRTTDVLSKRKEIKELFLQAGISDFMFHHQVHIAPMQFADHMASGFDNMFTGRQDVVVPIQNAFNSSIGEFARKKRQSFSIAFWIESILFLPRTISDYLGAKKDGSFMKIAQLIYWIIAAAGVLYAISQSPI